MKRLLTAVLTAMFLITVVACGDDTGNDPNPCDTANCGQGTCKATDGKAVCTCNSNYYPDSVGKCTWKFDTTEYLAYGEVCPTSSGKVEVKGQTGTYSGYNGYYVNVPSGAFDKCVLILLAPAVGTNLPSPGKPGKIVSTAHGLEVVAVDKALPLKADGNLNEVKILKEADVFFAKHRGQVLFFNSSASKFETVVKYTFLATGSLGVTKHLSPFYLLDSTPVLTATAVHKGSGKVELDFTGTKDENDGTPYMLTFSASGDGTPLTLTAVSGATHKFTSTLAGGTYKIIATVTDPYKGTDTKTFTLKVDLCANVQCKAWETCRTLDGKCIGTDPCSPDPCKNGGKCDNKTGKAVCSCKSGWLGKTCETKDKCYGVSCNSPYGSCDATTGNCKCVKTEHDPAKFCKDCKAGYINFPTCSVDLCAGNTCNGHGTCNATTGKCVCTGNWDSSGNCKTCLNGYVLDIAGKTCVTPSVTITTPLPAPCTTTPVKMCDGNKKYTISFTYTGNPIKITGWCTVNGSGTPGIITNIKFSNGKGTFTYNSSNDSAGDMETIHLRTEWGNSTNKTATHTHWIN